MRVGYHVEGARESVQDGGWWKERSLYFSVVAGTHLRNQDTTWPAAYESVRREYDQQGVFFTRWFTGMAPRASRTVDSKATRSCDEIPWTVIRGLHRCILSWRLIVRLPLYIDLFFLQWTFCNDLGGYWILEADIAHTCTIIVLNDRSSGQCESRHGKMQSPYSKAPVTALTSARTYSRRYASLHSV